MNVACGILSVHFMYIYVYMMVYSIGIYDSQNIFVVSQKG